MISKPVTVYYTGLDEVVAHLTAEDRRVGQSAPP